MTTACAEFIEIGQGMTGAHLDKEARAARGVYHGTHGGQVAAREYVLSDEVRRRAVRRVPLVRLRYSLPACAQMRSIGLCTLTCHATRS